MKHTKKLNLGSGEFKKIDFVNVDYYSKSKPDVVHNLNKMPYPFKTNWFNEIEANHVLEHLQSPFAVMKEIHRISEDNAKVTIRVPHCSRGFTHPEHTRGFDVSFPFYFNPNFQGGYQKVGFKLEHMKFTWFAQPYLKKTVMPLPLFFILFGIGRCIDFFANLSPFFCSRVWCFWVGGFDEIEFVFRTQKTAH